MDRYHALRLKALLAVMRPERDYFLRKIHRWYSKTFHTPIAEVEEIPIDVILEALYEEKYEAMTSQELDEERQEMLVTEEQRRQEMMDAEVEEAEAFDFAALIALEEMAKKKKAPQTAKPADPGQLASPGPKEGPISPRPRQEKESVLPTPKLLPAISMKFVDESEFDDELDGFGAMAQPPKP